MESKLSRSNRKKRNAPAGRSDPRNDRSKDTASPPPPVTRSASISPRRLWLFRFVVAVVVPLFLLAAAEIILRIAGVGRPMNFSYPATVNGRRVLLSNPYFTWQFFEPQMARAIEPFALRDPKPKDTCRIFVLGSSAAQGDPEPMFGLSRMLETMLTDQYPGVNFEVVNVATVAINSHVTLRIARACAKLDPDLFVVYMGNNEVTGPFGAGTVFSPLRSSRALIAAHLWAKRSRIGQTLESLKKAVVDRDRAPVPWLGMEMFLDRQVKRHDKSLAITYRNFGDNLKDIFKIARKKNIPVLVSSVAVNLKDCAPFASQHDRTLSDDKMTQFDELFSQAKALQEKDKNAEAISVYDQAWEIDSSYASLYYQIAKAYHSLNDYKNAGQYFRWAGDCDTLRFRADTKINRIIEDVTQKGFQNIHFIDGAAAMESHCDDGLPGLDLFYDHVHLNFAGTYILAKEYFTQMTQVLPPWVKDHSSGRPPLSRDQCEQRLCYTGIDRLIIARSMSNRLLRPPFTMQSDHRQQLDHFQQLMTEYDRFGSGVDLQNCLNQYEATVTARPNDDWMHLHYAKMLMLALNDLRRAKEHLRIVHQRFPQWVDGYNQMSKIAFLEGDTAEAESLCRKVLELNPYTADAFLGLGVIYQQKNQLDEAIEYLSKSILYDPYSSENHLALGIVFMAKMRLPDAIREMDRAIELDPTNAKAWFHRGYCLMVEKSDQPTRLKAIEYIHKSVELSPNFAEARWRLSMLLIQENRLSDAIVHLETLVKMRPQDAQIIHALALCLVQDSQEDPEKLKKARALLEKAVSMNEDFEKAQYDLGVVLVKLGEIAKAKESFLKVLRINPSNGPARKAIETIEQNTDEIIRN